MEFEYKISDWESFRKGFLQHKKFLSSKIEFEELDIERVRILTTNPEFNNWHLAEFGRFYGGSIFRNNFELDLIDKEDCKIHFEKPEKSKVIRIETKWNTPIEFKTFYLNCAEAYQTNVLANSLSETGVKKLNQKYPELKLIKDSFKTSPNFAYQIVKGILIIIEFERKSKICRINSLWKSEWNEK
ncbi:MAG: hypothetical protein R2828_14660 [Saprospiraceae bacterium]